MEFSGLNGLINASIVIGQNTNEVRSLVPVVPAHSLSRRDNYPVAPVPIPGHTVTFGLTINVPAGNLMNLASVSTSVSFKASVVPETSAFSNATDLVKWKFNDFNNNYQNQIINSIRRIESVIKIDEKYPVKFIPSFCRVCINHAESGSQYIPSHNSFDIAFKIVVDVLLENEVPLTPLYTQENKKIFDACRKVYVTVSIKKKERTNTPKLQNKSFGSIIEKMTAVMQRTFDRHPALQQHIMEIERLNFGTHLPSSEAIRWIVACLLIGKFHGMDVDYRHLDNLSASNNAHQILTTAWKIAKQETKYNHLITHFKNMRAPLP